MRNDHFQLAIEFVYNSFILISQRHLLAIMMNLDLLNVLIRYVDIIIFWFHFAGYF